MTRLTHYQVEEKLETYKSMMDAVPQSMFLLDRDKIIIGIFNAAEETLAGYPIESIVGKSILVYANDPQSPFCQACSMLNSTFETVFRTGVPLKFQYTILDTYMEATITKISGDRVLSQVQNITDIVLKRQDLEDKKHTELSMALMAGGLTSWSYNIQEKFLYSNQDNEVIDNKMPLDGLLSLIQPEYRQITRDMFDDIIERGCKSAHITVPARTRDGVVQWSDIHAIPLEYGPDGEVTLIVGSQKDISQEYEHNEKLKRLVLQNELILNNTHSGFAYLTIDMKVEWENVSKVFKDTEISKLFHSNLLNNNDGSEFCVKEIATEACNVRDKVVRTLKTVAGVIVEVLAQPVISDVDELVGVVMRFDDITQKEKTMCELAKAKEKAEQSDNLKSAFLANVSHEIRTPLNSIVGFAQLIPEAESEEQQRYIDIVNTNSEILLNLINDILDLSKIEAGYLNSNNTPFNLSNLFSELEFVFKFRMPEGVTLFCDIPTGQYFVSFDRMRISQVISNFMTNAIKFTRQGAVRMGFEVLPNGVRLFVKDTGCGMTEDQTKRVFDRFEKFNMFEQGTGLGAPIAKAIVEGCNGEIGVESEPEKGSTFWAFLPSNINANKRK